MVIDIAERRKAERLQHTLMNELNHRVKNTLATVQAIARQTFRKSHAVSGALETFESRLHALADAHNLLIRENWQGIELAELVAEVIAPHQRERFRIHGPNLRLVPRAALVLSMVLHELTTNAAKYGALSTSTGNVEIAWEISNEAAPQLTFRWTERGGPHVTPPTRKGFGTHLIERSLSAEIGGDVEIVYDPMGVICAMRIELGEGTVVPVEEAA